MTYLTTVTVRKYRIGFLNYTYFMYGEFWRQKSFGPKSVSAIWPDWIRSCLPTTAARVPMWGEEPTTLIILLISSHLIEPANHVRGLTPGVTKRGGRGGSRSAFKYYLVLLLLRQFFHVTSAISECVSCGNWRKHRCETISVKRSNRYLFTEIVAKVNT